jgi:hypothetical protein
MTECQQERIAIMIYDGKLSESDAIKKLAELDKWESKIAHIRSLATEQKMRSHKPNLSRKDYAAGEK